MREIEFRGIREDSEDWIYGDLLHYNEQTLISSHSIENIEDNYDENVIPDTVGQYTGLKDKNGNKIFEGDILEQKNGKQLIVGWHDTGFCTYENTNRKNKGIEVKNYPCVFFTNNGKSYTNIIGNIHQNKNLIL